MKKFKDLRESTVSSVFPETVDTNIINNLVKFAQQISGSFQPDMTLLINKIESELNKFALTLGDVDVDTPFEDTGTDDYVVLFYANKEHVKNIFLTLSWRKVSGQQFDYTAEGSKLVNDVHLIVNLVDPTDMDDIMNSEDDDEMTFVHLDEESESLDEESMKGRPDLQGWHDGYNGHDKPSSKHLEMYYKNDNHIKQYHSAYKDGADQKQKDIPRVDEARSKYEMDWDKSKSKIKDDPKTSTKDKVVDKMKKSFKDLRSKLDEESLDEISKDTLKSYIKKSANDITDKQITAVNLFNDRDLKKSFKVGDKIDKRIKNMSKAVDKLTEASDETDIIKINVPAFIRCMEYAMEDVKEDAELHEFVEHLLEISKTKDVITTDDYEKAVEACSTEEKAEMNESKTDSYKVFKFKKGNQQRYLQGFYDKPRSESDDDFKHRISKKTGHDAKDLDIELNESQQ